MNTALDNIASQQYDTICDIPYRLTPKQAFQMFHVAFREDIKRMTQIERMRKKLEKKKNAKCSKPILEEDQVRQ